MTQQRVRAALRLAVACAVLACVGGCAAPPPRYGLRLDPVERVSARPTLRWEPFSPPPEWDAGPEPGGTRVDGVAYDLRVIERRAGAVVYERTGLPAPEHAVEEPLEDSSGYVWTVRARVATSRGLRLGPWSQLADPGCAGRTPSDPPPVRLLRPLSSY